MFKWLYRMQDIHREVSLGEGPRRIHFPIDEVHGPQNMPESWNLGEALHHSHAIIRI